MPGWFNASNLYSCVRVARKMAWAIYERPLLRGQSLTNSGDPHIRKGDVERCVVVDFLAWWSLYGGKGAS